MLYNKTPLANGKGSFFENIYKNYEKQLKIWIIAKKIVPLQVICIPMVCWYKKNINFRYNIQ